VNVPGAFDIARWFKENHALTYQQGQTAEGLDYDMADDGYCYVWVMAFVDLDYDAFFLLDVRTKNEDSSEWRDFLFVGVGVTFGKSTPCEWQQKPVTFNDDDHDPQARLREGMNWMGQRIEFWTEDHGFRDRVAGDNRRTEQTGGENG
jgi:hypothetical protein